MPVGTIVRFAVVFLFSTTATSVCIAAPLTEAAFAPSFDCKAAHRPVEQKICKDHYLADADRWLAGVFKNRLAAADSPTRLQLVSEQRAWLKQLDECMEREDPDRTRPELGNALTCLQEDYDERIAKLEAPFRQFVDLSLDAPDAPDVCAAILALRAAGKTRLIARHELPFRRIDVISEVPSEEKIEHLRRYVDEGTWEKTSPWDEKDFTGSDYSVSVDRVPFYTDRPEAWVLSTVEGTLHIRRFWLLESSSDGTRADRYIGQPGGDNNVTNNPVFTRFRGHPFVIEGAVEFETAHSQFAVYDLDLPRNVCAGREQPRDLPRK